MGVLLWKNDFPVDGRTVLITGGSSGLGRDAGRQLAEKGANVIIVARNIENLKSGVEYISQDARSPSTQRFSYISADLRSTEECERVVAEATAWNDGAPPDVVWCCQGYSHPTLFIDTPVEKFRDQMDSNYFSCLFIAHAVLNRWLRPTTNTKPTKTPPARHLIFTSSLVSFLALTGYSPYSPSKLALRSLAESLTQEMLLYAGAHPSLPRVRIHTVYPATIKTSGLETENLIKTDVTKMLEEGDEGESPDECARAAIAGLEGGGGVITTRWMTWALWCAGLGASERRGWARGALAWVVSWVIGLVVLGVRWDMDRKVLSWGNSLGPSGMKKGRKE